MRSRFPKAAVLAAAVCLALVAGVAPARASARAGKVTRVTVTMAEYSFHLSVKKVPVGTVVFTVINKGQLAHIFEVQAVQKLTPLLQPGQRSVLKVTLRKPGKYYYLCPVGAHVQYGMSGYLQVTR